MIRQILNEFRQQNGKPSLAIDNYEENQNCLWHCFHMSRIQCLCHAPEHLRPGKSEACAVKSFYRNHYETLRAIVFEQFADSPGHRDILLSDNLAAAFHVEHYNVFVCVRGW
jgi:hypothetical protein